MRHKAALAVFSGVRVQDSASFDLCRVLEVSPRSLPRKRERLMMLYPKCSPLTTSAMTWCTALPLFARGRGGLFSTIALRPHGARYPRTKRQPRIARRHDGRPDEGRTAFNYAHKPLRPARRAPCGSGTGSSCRMARYTRPRKASKGISKTAVWSPSAQREKNALSGLRHLTRKLDFCGGLHRAEIAFGGLRRQETQ